jgi:hypothetical protein
MADTAERFLSCPLYKAALIQIARSQRTPSGQGHGAGSPQ